MERPATYSSRLKTIHHSIRITPIKPHKTLSLAADGVDESISERPYRYQVVRCFGGGAVARVALRYL